MPLLCLSLTHLGPAVSRATRVITSQRNGVPREQGNRFCIWCNKNRHPTHERWGQLGTEQRLEAK